MTCIADISNKIPIKFKFWMTEENWPIWLWMTDANSDCTPVEIHENPVFKFSELSTGTNSNEMLPCRP